MHSDFPQVPVELLLRVRALTWTAVQREIDRDDHPEMIRSASERLRAMEEIWRRGLSAHVGREAALAAAAECPLCFRGFPLNGERLEPHNIRVEFDRAQFLEIATRHCVP